MTSTLPLERRTTWIAVMLILAAGCSAYSNGFDGVFVLDDVGSIEKNAAIRRLWPPYAWLAYSPTRPLGYLTFAVNYALHGTAVFGYHVVNLTIHLAAASALFGLTRRTLRLPRLAERYRRRADVFATILTLFWAVHPLGTQAVTYVYQRLESLAALFALLSLYAFVRAYADGRRPQNGWAIVSLGCTYAGILSKESVVALPMIVLLYDFLFLAGSWRGVLERRRYYAASFCSWGVALGLMIASGRDYENAGIAAVEGLTPLSYALSQSGVLLRYLRLSIWPVGLCLDYGRPSARTWTEFAPQTIVVVGLLVGAGRGLFQRRSWSFPACAFFLLLAPTSSFVPIADLIFEHRMYLPLAAVLALLECGLVEVYERSAGYVVRPTARRRLRYASLLAGVGVGVVLGVLTYRRNEDYRSYERMWRDVAARAPGHARAYRNLADALVKQNRMDEARGQLGRALRLDPKSAHSLWLMAWIEIDDGDVIAAEPYLAQLEQLPAARSGYLALLGRMRTVQRRYEEAVALFRDSLALDPSDAYVVFNLGKALEGGGYDDEAARAYLQAVELQPSYSAAHNDLGSIYFRHGRYAEASAAFRAALVSDPQNVRARSNLGIALSRCGQTKEALRELQRCVTEDERYPGGHINLGIVLAQLGRFAAAEAQLEQALLLEPSNQPARESMLWVRSLRAQAATQSH